MTLTSQQPFLPRLYLQVYSDTLDLEAEKLNYLHSHSHSHTHSHIHTARAPVLKSDSTLNRGGAGYIHADMSGIVSGFLSGKATPACDNAFQQVDRHREDWWINIDKI